MFRCKSKEQRSKGATAAGGGGFEKHYVLKILGLKRPPKAAEEKPKEHRSKSPPEAAPKEHWELRRRRRPKEHRHAVEGG